MSSNSKFKSLKIRENTAWNYSYYPIILESESQLMQVTNKLNDQQIFPRRLVDKSYKFAIIYSKC